MKTTDHCTHLDNNSAADKRALDARPPFLTHNFANASSTHHFGIAANEATKNAMISQLEEKRSERAVNVKIRELNATA